MKIWLMFRHIAKLCAIIALNVTTNCYADPKINALRGAYLWYFSNLIDWPENSTYPDSKFVLCAATQDKEDIYQLSTIKKGVGSYPLKIKYISPLSEKNHVNNCHVLYIAKGVSSAYRAILTQPPAHTLLVTEGDSELKGHIHLFTLGTKLKFNINNSDLTSRGFKVSAKLLNLSKQPKGKPTQ
ncbi:MAG: YfiR family protein [Cellvibrionaceae bacterium]|nr:YfiR family protein [Cellvibrionaceae bacterium]